MAKSTKQGNRRHRRPAKQKQLNTFAKSDPIKVISSRFRYINLPSNTKQAILRDIQRWYLKNGKTEVVERLKYVRQCLIHYMADGSLPPRCHDRVWFKKNSKGLLYGPWSTLFKLTHTNPKAVLKLITCYTVFAVDSDPAEKQVQAFKNAVMAPFKGDAEALEAFNNKLYRHSPYILKRYVKSRRIYQDIRPPGNFWINARANNDGHKTDMVSQVLDLTSNREFYDMASRMPWVAESLSVDLQKLEPPVIPEAFKAFVKPPLVGEVQWLNEPGMKERIITDFKKPLEHLTFNLGKRLYDIVSLVPWDATYHEERGYKIIQEQLRNGKKAYCFDLSKATDRFPFSTQFAVLLGLDFGANYLDQLEILEYAVKGDALLPNYERVNWSVGQPMGYYPSFAMFTLTHGMVLMEYLYSHGIEYKGQFVVHGDDIVILDEALADFYKWFIEISGCDVNDFKTIKSFEFAEFNSRLVLKDSFITMRKWRPVSLASLMDQLPEWGPKAIDWVNCGKATKLSLRNILSIPGILPNGNSINPDGLSKQMRLERVHKDLLDAAYTTPVAKSNFVSYRNLVLDRFRRNCFIYHKEVEICELLAESIVLQSHLDALNVADNLDRGLLLDLYPFVEYNMPFNGYNTHVLRGVMSPHNADIAAQFLPNVGHMLAEFNETFCIDTDKLFTFSFIKQLDTRTHRNGGTITKLTRLLEVYKNLDVPIKEIPITSARENEIA